MKPIILVTTDRRDEGGFHASPFVRPKRTEVWLTEAYVAAVRESGGIPLLVPPGDPDCVDSLVARCHGVLLTGGAFDIHPSWYGEAVTGRLDRVDESRTELEIALARRCLSSSIPVLGICGGMQVLAVASGGRLMQDLPPSDGVHLAHEQPTDPAQAWHHVRVEAPAETWLGRDLEANSTHHQAVRAVGPELVPCGWTNDGVIEVIAARGGFALGVQWHPELLGDQRPYAAFIAAARDYSRSSPSGVHVPAGPCSGTRTSSTS